MTVGAAISWGNGAREAKRCGKRRRRRSPCPPERAVSGDINTVRFRMRVYTNMREQIEAGARGAGCCSLTDPSDCIAGLYKRICFARAGRRFNIGFVKLYSNAERTSVRTLLSLTFRCRRQIASGSAFDQARCPRHSRLKGHGDIKHLTDTESSGQG
uniref:Uncharacterized protein n=1 Tax=Cryptomonas curvata TaxID=233186 RepID=A0A6T8CW82_9CRYP|mmetsp:Transcript_55905/g.116965  ORF Transcript_55905/g.116965 Transcript_55905/m.116965 type:complete len:157 (+) Transcript_55905:590-1060(+)